MPDGLPPYVQYEFEHEGTITVWKVCPKCARFTSAPKTEDVKWRELDGLHAPVVCKRCGPVMLRGEWL